MTEPEIIPLWQPVGNSTHIIASKVAKKLNKKTSHTGTLDPMAEGIIVILAGETRLKKKELAKWPKEYKFDVALGISTDTYDGLGLIQQDSFSIKNTSKFFSHREIFVGRIKQALSRLQGDYVQEVPPFSAIKVSGKPLHWYARNKNLPRELPKRSGEIFDIELLDFKEVSLQNLISDLLEKISKVTGDLRQGEIAPQWRDFAGLREKSKDVRIPIISIRATLSKGLYVRSLSQDICGLIGVKGFVSNLVRTRNGSFHRENSLSLEEFFGSGFRDKYDFVSRFKS
ncbi:hypothetical protein GF360_01835 [candidate division WWE3 bacterium]|nr:hypothetical protein [candidate division WWE3 bacterium]